MDSLGPSSRLECSRYQIAQREAQRAGGIKIEEAQLEGEEFLERADVEQITGNSMPVTLF
jgi:hypothetical protein